jgi:hypothetical protein
MQSRKKTKKTRKKALFIPLFVCLIEIFTYRMRIHAFFLMKSPLKTRISERAKKKKKVTSSEKKFELRRRNFRARYHKQLSRCNHSRSVVIGLGLQTSTCSQVILGTGEPAPRSTPRITTEGIKVSSMLTTLQEEKINK